MRFKKFAAIILMSTMIGTMSLSGCGGVNKDAVAITMTSDDKDAIEVTMGYANFAARIQQAGYDSMFLLLIMEMTTGQMTPMQRMERTCRNL